MLRAITAACEAWVRELAAESPELRVELTDDDELVVYREACWQREFGGSEPDKHSPREA